MPNQSVAVLNETYDVTKSIDAALSTNDGLVDYSVESDWFPGEPLYPHPRDRGTYWVGTPGGPDEFLVHAQTPRSMIQLRSDSADDDIYMCDDCETIWYDNSPCWVCGVRYDEPYRQKYRRVCDERREHARKLAAIEREAQQSYQDEFNAMHGFAPVDRMPRRVRWYFGVDPYPLEGSSDSNRWTELQNLNVALPVMHFGNDAFQQLTAGFNHASNHFHSLMEETMRRSLREFGRALSFIYEPTIRPVPSEPCVVKDDGCWVGDVVWRRYAPANLPVEEESEPVAFTPKRGIRYGQYRCTNGLYIPMNWGEYTKAKPEYTGDYDIANQIDSAIYDWRYPSTPSQQILNRPVTEQRRRRTIDGGPRVPRTTAHRGRVRRQVRNHGDS